MVNGVRPGLEVTREDARGAGVDATTILDNVVLLDQMLDEGSRRELDELPYLELSKHLKIKR
jgi:hypothetical protein